MHLPWCMMLNIHKFLKFISIFCKTCLFKFFKKPLYFFKRYIIVLKISISWKTVPIT